jgi:tetratricopeptide (TPR) repeat protein
VIASDHYDDEMLVAIAEDRAQQDTDTHLSECDECRDSVDQYRSMISCLSDEAMWVPRPLDETPNPQTIATLRSYVDQMQREDAEAEPLVAELLAGTREEWMPRLMADEKYRTAGVVRKLIAAMPTFLQTCPADAVFLTELNVRLAGVVRDSDLRTAHSLLGAAWRERAYALFYSGEIGAAQDAVATSVAMFSQVVGADYELARVQLVSAQVLRQVDRIDEALFFCESAEEIFSRSGSVHRVAMARSVRAYVLSKRLDFRQASDLTRETVREFGHVLTQHELATLIMNLGYYERELGRFESALEQLREAGFIFDEIGSHAEAARMRWNVAAVLRASGDSVTASRRYEEVVRDFERLGMLGTAAVASLDLAEVLLERGEDEDAERLCKDALAHFGSTGLAYSSRAMTAIAYLKECCGKRVATSATVGHVKAYIRDLPRNPTLAFAPLPDQQL